MAVLSSFSGREKSVERKPLPVMKIRKFGRRSQAQDDPGADGQKQGPTSNGSDVAAAEAAFRDQQWSEVVERLTPLLDHVDVTPQLYVWVSIAHREQGDLDGAEVVILAGRARFPDSSIIAVEWADIAMKQRDWGAAASRLEELTSTTEKLPPVAYVKLAIAKSDLGDFDGADKAIAEGWAVHGRLQRLDIEHAQIAIKAQQWTEAIERLKWVLANHNDAPPVIYLKLAVANKAIGHYAAADVAIMEGWEKHGRSERFDFEWAQVAMSASRWVEAVRRFEWLIGHYGELDSVVYIKLAICRFKAGNLIGADRAIYSGWTALGHQIELDLEWAALAKKAKNSADVVSRYRTVIERHGHAVGADSYVAFAQGLAAEGSRDEAIEVLHQTSEAFRHDGLALIELANVLLQVRNYSEAASYLEAAIKRDPAVDPRVYGRLAHVYRSDGKYNKAKEICRLAVEQWPSSAGSLSRWAQEAMIENDWPTALKRWQDLVTSEDERNAEKFDNDQLLPLVTLPEKAADLEWHEGHWRRFADSWVAGNGGAVSASATLYLALADVLIRVGSGSRALAILRQGVAVYPRHARLKYRLALFTLEASKPIVGQPSGIPVWSTLPESMANQALRDEIQAMEVSFAAAAPISRVRPTMEYRQFNVCQETSLELLVKGGRFFSANVVEERIRLQSEAELWPEMPQGSVPLEREALELANEFRSRFESQTDLAGPMLTEAVFRLIYAELCVREPVRRLAASIAKEAGTDPVFVELSGKPIEYMSSFTPTEIGQFYLYRELYRLGANVFFCCFVNQRSDPYQWNELNSLVLRPSPVLLRSRGTTKEVDKENTEVAVVPAGIRSIQTVVDELVDPLVYASGYVIQGLAYDRTTFEPLDLSATFLPPRSLLPVFKYDYDTVAWFESSDLVGANETSQTQLGLTVPIEGDWLDWLGEMLLPSLNEMYELCVAEVDLRQVKQAHVADNLYMETTVFAAAVSSRGGNVTLWPHSANPVDVQARHRDTFDRVNAVTQVGCETWKARFPDVEVAHRPDLMLDTPTMQLIDPNEPLSVVILGGKNTLGLMPFVHQSQHEVAYNKFFNGLEQLKNDCNIEIYFKPKGLSGENEAWLDRVIDGSVEWKTVVEHPLRLALPNMMFVSLSVASSAILEGLGRGIPGLVVAEALARDYTTIDGSSISSGSCAEIVEMVRRCALPGGLEELLASQWPYYRSQTGYHAPIIDLGVTPSTPSPQVNFAGR